MAEKYKSKARKKLKAAKDQDEAGGRSLSYKSMEGKHKGIAAPKSRKKEFFGYLRGKAKESLTRQAKSMLPETGLGLGMGKGLSDIKHPAQLIPMISKGRTLAGIIKSMKKK